MPLGRIKDRIWVSGPDGDGFPWVMRSPVWPVVAASGGFAIQWLLYKFTGAPAANQTIELCGDGSTRGYQLEYLPTGAFRFTVYRAGPASTSVTSTNTIAAESNVFVYVAAIKSGNNIRIRLNDTVGALTAATMVATVAGDDRLMGAEDLVAPAAPLFNLLMAGTTFSVGTDSDPYQATRRAQRLVEARNMLSYIDFGRVRGNPFVRGDHFGDDVTGARVESPPGGAGCIAYRSDRTTDWSTA